MTTKKKGPRVPKVAGLCRTIVSANVLALLAHKYPSLTTITRRQKQFEEDGLGAFTTIQRVCSKTGGVNLETLEQIAAGFDLSAYQLLIPSLDPKNPQIVKGATQAEQRIWKAIERSRDGLVKEPA